MIWIFIYLWGTTKTCLCFKKGELKLHSYVDADYARNVDNRRNIIGYLFSLGENAIS